MTDIDLSPKYFLKENGLIQGLVPPDFDNIFGPGMFYSNEGELFAGRFTHDDMPEANKLLRYINNTKIKLAEFAESTSLKTEGEIEYIKSELGMNIILPKGNIDSLRFKVDLKPCDGRVFAVDGFPNDSITNKPIINGTINLGIDKLYKFIPIPSGIPNPLNLLEIKLNPIEFQIGNLKKINIDFGGGLTCTPEWYFTKAGIGNGTNARFALTIKKPKNLQGLNAEVEAIWQYSSGFIDSLFKWGTVKSEKRVIKII